MSNQAYRRYTRIYGETFGPATISGTTKKLTENYGGQPVFLFLQDGFRLVRETVSDANGAYSFPNVLSATEWIVASIDRSGAYNIVAADRVITP